jgi:hypothetical protein
VRFTCDNSHFNAQGPKWKFFEPSKAHNETSVFLANGTLDAEIWDLGDQFARRGDRTPIALATITSADVGVANKHLPTAELRLELDNNPPRHGAIVGWPEAKEEMRVLAHALAAKATLLRRPS